MKIVGFITENYILDVALVAWLLAQTLKIVFVLITKKRLDLRRFVGAGGMPSSHTATVVAMTVAVEQVSGFRSVEFAISMVLSMIVMYDAAGVRRAAGEQAKILNYMMEHWKETTPEMFSKELKELLGHTPYEVIVGVILGILVAFVAKLLVI